MEKLLKKQEKQSAKRDRQFKKQLQSIIAVASGIKYIGWDKKQTGIIIISMQNCHEVRDVV